MTRDELIAANRALVEEGEALGERPSLPALRDWLARSDAVLSAAWGTMDRYHLAWLLVGKPPDVVRGRPMTDAEEGAYVRDVAAQKTAALRMSLDAVERQRMPFVGEDGGLAPGDARGGTRDGFAPGDARGGTRDGFTPGDVRGGTHGGAIMAELPPDADDLAARIRRAREEALAHEGHPGRRAPRPERMQR